MTRYRFFSVLAAGVVLLLGGVLSYSFAQKGGGASTVPVLPTASSTHQGSPVAAAPSQVPTQQAAPAEPTLTQPFRAAIPPSEKPVDTVPTAQPTLPPQPRAERPRRRPLAVMVENQEAARPQSGLDTADVVYEAPAEGGIPRFLAIFSSEDAPVLGPVRSARAYFVAWASEYDPVFVHAGGSPQALRWLEQLGTDSIDALGYYPGGFWRSKDRRAPHNLYANTVEVRELIIARPRLQDSPGSWGGLRFSDSPTTGVTQGGNRVTVSYEGGYSVAYAYNRATGLYKREMLGKVHKDRESGKGLTASAVIVQTVRMWPIEGDPAGRLEAQVQGRGKVVVFQNGQVIEGYWEKRKRDAPTMYTTVEGGPITLKPGPVWIQVAPLSATVQREG